ncbi:MAG TPA: PAS domain S-box protein, partial [Bryobacteraceae bacterium]|nr:PAS domain S-box protein [Bryobacteraceae bacterium]
MPHRDPAQFLRALLDASPFGIIALDESGEVRLWNRAAQTILGWSEEAVMGHAPPFDLKLPRFPMDHAEVSLFRNDCTSIDVELRTALWQEGTVIILTDISQQRRAQREIAALAEREREARAEARAEHRFRELLDAAPDAIIEVDREGRIVLLNPFTEKMFGYGREELQGKPLELLLPDDLRAIHALHRARYWTQPVTRPMGMGLSLHGKRKDGALFPVDISLSAVQCDEGFRVTAIIRDVTDRRQTETRLQALREEYTRDLELRNQEIERANRLKSEFLANMSHELRTPLHTVIGFSELLLEEAKGPLNSDQKRFVGHIHKDAHHLLALINEVLDLS